MPRRFTSHDPKPARILCTSGTSAAPRAKAPRPAAAEAASANKTGPREVGGPSGPEPTRYGDWERKGICVDF